MASNNDRTILVSGATGQQGGAVLRHLRERHFPVRALTRTRTAPKRVLCKAFEHSGHWNGKTYELAGDEPSMQEIAQALGHGMSSRRMRAKE